MNKELTEKLWNDFPLLYRDKNGPITQTLIPFGFECSSGWEPIIRSLSAKLEPLIQKFIDDNKDQYPEVVENYPRAIQVKEKYSTLSFYMTSSTDEMEDLIRVAEKESGRTCEYCGKEGHITKHGWLRTLCDDCEKSFLKDRSSFYASHE
jgi:hypothetical protein